MKKEERLRNVLQLREWLFCLIVIISADQLTGIFGFALGFLLTVVVALAAVIGYVRLDNRPKRDHDKKTNAD